ncbi:MAG: hypothetical protein FWD58_11360 [Firmicutes bacterium]|nr:hypothetical protein [Bacillota bacterium]
MCYLHKFDFWYKNTALRFLCAWAACFVDAYFVLANSFSRQSFCLLLFSLLRYEPCALKEIINQVSHSKKWRSDLESGVKSYSKLQDDFNEYMRGAGYDVERGEKGSTAENLSVIEFKTQQENQRLQDLVLQAMSQKEVLEEYEKKIKVKKDYVKVSKQLKEMGKPVLIGTDVKLTQEEFKDLKALAKNGISLQDENRKLKKEIIEVKKNFNAHAEAHNGLVAMYHDLQSRFDDLTDKYNRLKEKAQPFFDAVKYAPEKVWDFITNILGLQRQEQEQARELERQQRQLKKQKSYDRGGR